LGLWTDSTKADWQIQEQGKDYLKIKISFHDLPLIQTWKIKINNEQQIEWQIDMEINERLHIDEFRIACLTDPRYKTWINDYQQGYFPRLQNYWCDLCPSDQPASLVGVRFPTGERFLPSFMLEIRGERLLPLIQNPPQSHNTHIVGFRRIDPEEKKDYSPGFYNFFTGRLCVFEDDYLLDTKLENLRRSSLKATVLVMASLAIAVLPITARVAKALDPITNWPDLKALLHSRADSKVVTLSRGTSLVLDASNACGTSQSEGRLQSFR